MNSTCPDNGRLYAEKKRKVIVYTRAKEIRLETFGRRMYTYLNRVTRSIGKTRGRTKAYTDGVSRNFPGRGGVGGGRGCVFYRVTLRYDLRYTTRCWTWLPKIRANFHRIISYGHVYRRTLKRVMNYKNCNSRRRVMSHRRFNVVVCR